MERYPLILCFLTVACEWTTHQCASSTYQGTTYKLSYPTIKRVKNHIFSFPFGVDVVLGHNGGIWISSPPASDDNTAIIKVPAETREKIARVRNCITILSNLYAPISPESIQALYDTSLQSSTPAKDLLKPEVIQVIFRRF